MRGRVVLLVAILLAMLHGLTGLRDDWSPKARAQEAPTGRWERLPLRSESTRSDLTGVFELWGPPSGPLFARVGITGYRSDDAGSTWTKLPLTGVLQAVDPRDPNVVYVHGNGGLLRSDDGGVTPRLIVPTSGQIEAVVAAPSDPATVYVALRGDSEPGKHDWATLLLRSRDAGQTWDRVDVQVEPPGETWYRTFLFIHPGAADRLFSHRRGGPNGRPASQVEPLRESRDGGTTWTDSLQPAANLFGMAGGSDIDPSRLYAFDRGRGPDGGDLSRVYRSDDDGASWRTVSELPGALVSSVAYDPDRPDRVWVGRSGAGAPGIGVWESIDGGESWSETDSQALGQVYSLLRGIDGRYLFAGTQDGLWRLPLDDEAGLPSDVSVTLTGPPS